MLAVVKSIAMNGLEGRLVNVEVDISAGLPSFEIVGLPGKSVRESRERVRAAVKNAGFSFPMGRITVNLAPADLKKESPGFDLAIALGVLAAAGELKANLYPNYYFLGELSLDGTVRGISGVLPAVMSVGNQPGHTGFVIPRENADEAALFKAARIFPVKNLREAVFFGEGRLEIERHSVNLDGLIAAQNGTQTGELAEVSGQEPAKRALEVAAAGGHNLLMIGPPGSGKTMLAGCLPGILPPMSHDEILTVTKIYSVTGLLKNGVPLVAQRPFRAPHASVSKAGLAGGGNNPKPGEISLAHLGILFLDEFPEFPKESLESLRQPMEDGRVSIARMNGRVEYPAQTMVVAAMNPCPCGFFGDDIQPCGCTPGQLQRYKNRISGPLLDRMDLQIWVPRVKFQELRRTGSAETSDQVCRRVTAARRVQEKRYRERQIFCNAQMGSREVHQYCRLERRTAALAKDAFEKFRLSARGLNRLLKVTRTIADLEGSHEIAEHHLAEAIQYRCLDRSVY